METKEDLINNIKEWTQMNVEITQLRREIKLKNDRKKIITNKLIDTMKQNEIDCFDISSGSLVYKKNISKKSINSKSLLIILQKYYNTQTDDKNIAVLLTDFILDNREEQTKETIKLKK
jgi:hypothetical protein